MADNRPFKDATLFHHHRKTKRFMAWVRRPSLGNVRFYIGCYNTFHMAARAQDRAILRIDLAAPVNFKASDYQDDATLRTTMSEDAFLKMLKDEARPWYKVVAKKSRCFTRFQRMEEHMKDLRTLNKFTIREFVAHLADNPSPSPELNEAALTLLEIFGSTDIPGIDDPVAEETDCSVKLDFLADFPKGKRSPRTSKEGAADGGAGPCSQGSNRLRTRGYCKRKLNMTSCPNRRPRS